MNEWDEVTICVVALQAGSNKLENDCVGKNIFPTKWILTIETDWTKKMMLERSRKRDEEIHAEYEHSGSQKML